MVAAKTSKQPQCKHLMEENPNILQRIEPILPTDLFQ